MRALDAYKSKTMRAAWRPPLMAEFQQRTIVKSFDQTLRQTGYIKLGVREGNVHVLERGTLRTRMPEGMSSFEAKYDLADQLWAELEALEDDAADNYGPTELVREMPPVQGHRIDSSFLAGYVVRGWMQRRYRTPGTAVSIQASRTILGGSTARNDKRLGHEALARYIPESTTRQWNEHQRDAAINALAHLYTLRQKENR